ncbi:MAG TPA: SpoIIE family protein phosphatase [Oligoflexia bacterium]|nr:SpoIIE family protein phosphatase [Oligoflexia bacterium]HMR24539.1 SpoIIE family protein phosphatase [Oligoflexia bacterium]
MDQYIFESKDFVSEVHTLKTGSYALASMQSPAKKTVNEDACCFFSVSSKLNISVVCDGVGGSPNGNKASRLIVEKIKAACLSKKKQKIRNAILDAIEDANDAILKNDDGSLSTCVVAEIHPTWVRFYHCGDSMGLILNEQGELIYYTVSHAPLAYGLELGVERSQLQHIKNLVNNVVGSTDLRIEMSAEIPLEKNDRIFLMSDGLSDNYKFTKLCKKLSKATDLRSLLDDLKNETLERMLSVEKREFGGPDDLTVVAYQTK